MDSMFADIEKYPSDTSSGRSQLSRHFRSVTSCMSTAHMFYEAVSQSAAIGDEHAAERQIQQDLLRRVVELEALYYEDYGVPLNAPSLQGFECFMKYSPDVAMPLLGAEPSGTLIATWNKGAECLSLRFSDRYHLDFAVTFLRDGEQIRNWGKSSLSNIFGDCPQARRLASI